MPRDSTRPSVRWCGRRPTSASRWSASMTAGAGCSTATLGGDLGARCGAHALLGLRWRDPPRLLAHQSVQDRAGRGRRARDRSAEVMRNIERLRLDALLPIGGEDTLGVATRLGKLGVARRRHPEDHRQGSRRHRLHARLRHLAAHLRRHHRAFAHAGWLASLGPVRRGDGPPRRTPRACGRGSRAVLS